MIPPVSLRSFPPGGRTLCPGGPWSRVPWDGLLRGLLNAVEAADA
jgi:hypothetical protein